MILVTGATGQLGGRIVDRLVARLGTQVARNSLAVSVRDPAKAEAFTKRGITVHTGNFDEPQALQETFAGVDRLVLVSTDGPKEERVRQHRNAIEAAKAAGVKHVIYTSFLDAGPDSPADFAAVHYATERDLRASGLKFTLIRNALYADFLPMTLGNALESGVFYVSAGSGKASFVSRDDLADAIAAAAVAPQLAKDVYELTGQAAYTYAEVAAAVARATRKPVRYEAVSEDVYAKALEGYGVPVWLARSLANMYTAVAAGKFAKLSNDFALLTGHLPKSLDCLVAELFTKQANLDHQPKPEI
jgi:NAD(P)H dehydrogenase (quinone)